MTGDCGDCAHAHAYFVRVGDCAYGNDVEDFCCDREDDMTDDDVELANAGKCPMWEKMTDDDCTEGCDVGD